MNNPPLTNCSLPYGAVFETTAKGWLIAVSLRYDGDRSLKQNPGSGIIQFLKLFTKYAVEKDENVLLRLAVPG
jgi:hypothetical protein